MREETGHKIILQMTDKGLRALRLESAQLADALENLKAGRRPQGTEIEEVPDDFLPLANCLETLGRGWMLLDSEGNLEQKAPSALDAPSQLMEELNGNNFIFIYSVLMRFDTSHLHYLSF